MGGDGRHRPVVREVREVGEIGVVTAVELKANVRFWHLADIDVASENVRFRG